MIQPKPAEVFHPGEYIREEMEARGWTIEEFAAKLCRTPTDLRRLLDGRGRVTPSFSKDLGMAFGPLPAFWLNLQKAYDDAG